MRRRALTLALLVSLPWAFAFPAQTNPSAPDSSPFNFKEQPIEWALRDSLVIQNYRFDEESGFVLSPTTKKPITKTEMQTVLLRMRLEYRDHILERIYNLVSEHPPLQPVPPELLKRIKALAGFDPDLMPPSLLQALENAQETSALLRSEAEKAYVNSFKLWDNNRSGQNRAADPASNSVYWNDSEKDLGESLVRETISHFSGNSAGAALLSKFPKKSGKIRFPPMIIARIHPSATAAYNPLNPAIIINGHILDEMIPQVPEKERPNYIIAHPEISKSLIAHLDEVLAHEAVHGLQDLTDAVDLETRSDNLPGAGYLEYEHEARLESARYSHSKLLTDAASAVRSEHFEDYLNLLSSFENWKDVISRSLLEDSPESMADFKTIESIQRKRMELAGRFFKGRLQSMRRGLKALSSASGRVQGVTDQFLRSEYPRMRREGYGALASYWATERPDRSFSYALKSVRSEKKPPEEMEGAAEKTIAWLSKPGSEIPALEKTEAVNGLIRYYDEIRKPRPQALKELEIPILKTAAWNHFAQARSEKDSAAKARHLEAAENYGKKIGDQKLLTQIEAMRTEAMLQGIVKAVPESLQFLRGFEENKSVIARSQIRIAALSEETVSIPLPALSPKEPDVIVIDRAKVLQAVQESKNRGISEKEISGRVALLLLPDLVATSQLILDKKNLLEEAPVMPLVWEHLVVSYAKTAMAYEQIGKSRDLPMTDIFLSYENIAEMWSEGFISFQISLSQALKKSEIPSLKAPGGEICGQNDRNRLIAIARTEDPETKRLLQDYHDKGKAKPCAAMDPDFVSKAKEYYRQEYLKLQKNAR